MSQVSKPIGDLVREFCFAQNRIGVIAGILPDVTTPKIWTFRPAPNEVIVIFGVTIQSHTEETHVTFHTGGNPTGGVKRVPMAQGIDGMDVSVIGGLIDEDPTLDGSEVVQLQFGVYGSESGSGSTLVSNSDIRATSFIGISTIDNPISITLSQGGADTVDYAFHYATINRDRLALLTQGK